MTLEIYNKLYQRSQKNRHQSVQERSQVLKKLQSWILDHAEEIAQTLHADFNKHPFEGWSTEVYTSLSDLKHTLNHLSDWMSPRSIETPITMLGHSSWVQYENKGVVLIISPWNYPWYLTISPLISALAAGNSVILKPSELTPKTSSLIEKMVSACFDTDLVRCFTGDKDVAQKLLELPLHHVFFTGSTDVGRIVAEACAKRLIPYTLELGGRSPVIIDETADIKAAAEKVFWTKIMNRGQTCVAANHVFIHQTKKSEFLKHYSDLNQQLKDSSSNLDWTSVVNVRHQERVEKLSKMKWTKDQPTELIEFTNFSDFKSHPVSQEEIFGPVIPLLTYASKAELLSFLGFEERPLTCAVFSKNSEFVDEIRRHYPSGSLTINTLTIHVGNSNLPFGGIGPSGVGRSHGLSGFREFSNERAFMKQNFEVGLQKMIMPPYKPQQLSLIKWLTKKMT